MAGVSSYTDEEIQFVLNEIVRKTKASVIQEQFKERFGRELQPTQLRYLKNKYGRDARYGSVLVNYRGRNAADMASRLLAGHGHTTSAGPSTIQRPLPLALPERELHHLQSFRQPQQVRPSSVVSGMSPFVPNMSTAPAPATSFAAMAGLPSPDVGNSTFNAPCGLDQSLLQQTPSFTAALDNFPPGASFDSSHQSLFVAPSTATNGYSSNSMADAYSTPMASLSAPSLATSLGGNSFNAFTPSFSTPTDTTPVSMMSTEPVLDIFNLTGTLPNFPTDYGNSTSNDAVCDEVLPTIFPQMNQDTGLNDSMNCFANFPQMPFDPLATSMITAEDLGNTSLGLESQGNMYQFPELLHETRRNDTSRPTSRLSRPASRQNTHSIRHNNGFGQQRSQRSLKNRRIVDETSRPTSNQSYTPRSSSHPRQTSTSSPQTSARQFLHPNEQFSASKSRNNRLLHRNRTTASTKKPSQKKPYDRPAPQAPRAAQGPDEAESNKHSYMLPDWWENSDVVSNWAELFEETADPASASPALGPSTPTAASPDTQHGVSIGAHVQ